MKVETETQKFAFLKDKRKSEFGNIGSNGI